MSEKNKEGLFSELKRRHVFRAGISYLVVGWLVIEVASVLLPTYEAPAWVMRALTTVIILGFPVALVLAWAFELTPEGLKPDPGSERSAEDSRQQELLTSDTQPGGGQGKDARIAVLPLDTMSDSQDDEYLADGLTEDLITLLSRTPGLFVIARNSSFVFKGQSVSIRKIARDLGVRYVIEGSMRRFGEQLRINIQLIDGANEQHVWAERYDCHESALFSMQDDISQKIAAQLSIPIMEAETDRAQRLHVDDIDAWLLTQRAIRTYYFTGPDLANARASMKLLNEALEKEPDYPYALAFQGLLLCVSVMFGFSDDVKRDAKLAFEQVTRASGFAFNDPMVQWCTGVVQGFLGDIEVGIGLLERSVKGNPNNCHSRADLGHLLARVGRREEGEQNLLTAFELSPHEPRAYIWHYYLGSLDFDGDLHKALKEFGESVKIFSKYIPALLGRVIVLQMLGESDAARAAMDAFKANFPQFDFAMATQLLDRGGPVNNQTLKDKMLQAMTDAGLKEQT